MSLTLGHRKHLRFRVLCHDFPSKVFCLTVPKHFVEEPSYAVFQKIRVAKKFMDKREGEVSRFPAKVFCLTVPKKAGGEHFSLSVISGIEKVCKRGWGECQKFPSKNSFLTVPKNFVVKPFSAVFQKTSGSGKAYG